MRVVATYAFASFYSRMDHGFVQAYLLFWVAGEAHLISWLLEQQLRDYTVSQMTFLTFFLFHNRMYTFHPDVFICKLLMTVQTILAGESPFFGGGGAGGEVSSGAQKK